MTDDGLNFFRGFVNALAVSAVIYAFLFAVGYVLWKVAGV